MASLKTEGSVKLEVFKVKSENIESPIKSKQRQSASTKDGIYSLELINFASQLKPGALTSALAHWGTKVGYAGDEEKFLFPMPTLDTRGKLVLPDTGYSLSSATATAASTGGMSLCSWSCFDHLYEFCVWLERDVEYARRVIRPMAKAVDIKHASCKIGYSTWLRAQDRENGCHTLMEAKAKYDVLVNAIPDASTKIRVMKLALQAKFDQSSVLGDILLSSDHVGGGKDNSRKIGLLIAEVRNELLSKKAKKLAVKMEPCATIPSPSVRRVRKQKPIPSSRSKPSAITPSTIGTKKFTSIKEYKSQSDQVISKQEIREASEKLRRLMRDFARPTWMTDACILEYLADMKEGKTTSMSSDVGKWITECEAASVLIEDACKLRESMHEAKFAPGLKRKADEKTKGKSVSSSSLTHVRSVESERSFREPEAEFPLGEQPTSIHFDGINNPGSNKKSRWML
jgi:hypothetical protein